ncbi:MAG: L,D-transpeptidase [Anaerolineales bacterium]|nr:L,D-transpeptidase [Anaerolineales bacterium]
MNACTRRTFLKAAGASLAGAASALAPRGIPRPDGQHEIAATRHPEDQPPSYCLARTTANGIRVHDEPDSAAPVLRRLYRDQIVTALEEIQAAKGPEGNPRWFRLLEGFAHTANLQEVRYDFQPAVFDIPEGGILSEVTVPFTQSRHGPSARAAPLYRLYYKSVYWVTGISVDEDGRPWYAILDDWLHYTYYARAEHLRPFAPEELAPISPDVPPDSKQIDVDLTRQTVTALECEQPVFTAVVSSGWLRKNPQPGQGRTITPIGRFRVFEKVPSRHMGNGRLTSEIEAYELPGVPFVSFFHILGTAFHGAYWHNDFGRPASQGCLNMRPDEARWLYRWIHPTVAWEIDPPKFEGQGTEVYLHD